MRSAFGSKERKPSVLLLQILAQLARRAGAEAEARVTVKVEVYWEVQIPYSLWTDWMRRIPHNDVIFQRSCLLFFILVIIKQQVIHKLHLLIFGWYIINTYGIIKVTHLVIFIWMLINSKYITLNKNIFTYEKIKCIIINLPNTTYCTFVHWTLSP